MNKPTVEQRIVEEYQCSVPELLQTYAGAGMTSKEVARELRCGVSNVRRIARKYNIRFNQPAPQAKIIHSEEFLDTNLNHINILSRSWGQLVQSNSYYELADNANFLIETISESTETDAVSCSYTPTTVAEAELEAEEVFA